MAKLQETNTKRANAVTVFLPTAPPVSYSSDHMSVETEILIIQIGEEAIQEGAVAGAEDRAGPRQTPLILPSLKKVKGVEG